MIHSKMTPPALSKSLGGSARMWGRWCHVLADVSAVRWLRERDRGWVALRRAGRTALVMPAIFAVCVEVIGNPAVATFAAFGSFAMLLLVDFAGPMRARLQAQAALAVTGAVFVCAGTLVSRSAWLAAVAMALVAFGVLFAGVVSSVLAGATTSLLLGVHLAGVSARTPSPRSRIVSPAGVWRRGRRFWWRRFCGPRRPAIRCVAQRSRVSGASRPSAPAEVAYVLGGDGCTSSAQDRDRRDRAGGQAVEALHAVFFATPYRPTGLSTRARTIVRLVDELRWLNRIVMQAGPPHRGRASIRTRTRSSPPPPRFSTARRGSARVPGRRDTIALQRRADTGCTREARRAGAWCRVEAARPSPWRTATSRRTADGPSDLTSLDPSFRAQEIELRRVAIAANIELAAAAARPLAGSAPRPPSGRGGRRAALRARSAPAPTRSGTRSGSTTACGAADLGIAVLVAELTGVQHAFWVVFGTLSVLRSSAL